MQFRKFFISSLLGCFTPIALASSLKSDEYVMFIPDIAYQTTENKIAVNVQAWVYEKERRLGMTTTLTKYLGINKDQLSPEQYARLYERSQLFRVDSERGKNIKVQFADQSIHSLPTTNKDGRANKTVYFATDAAISNNNLIAYQLYQSGTPAGADNGYAIFASPEGLSVISDIDDTIKDSNVLDRQQLLVNTFIEEFKAIDSMRDWYRYIADNNKQTIAFHYVSSSPIQLYPALKEFMDKANFPLGSFHLREGTTWNSVVATGDDSLQHKKSSIEKLLTAYPKRQFILIGDSGEADPEIYADMMRRHPEQVNCIAIRNVTDEDNQNSRYQQTFKDLDINKWRVFTDPTDLKDWCISTQ
ncbi:phosphatidate phosphatase App1 family protein [Entomomonas asaccharolytica]|uniref:App1 family protein n=1 Tax=Entomomonas asaccharolytica TaxID=2785331 RepID=A0A974NDA0_9GAMM|nr:phosphatase domain-containing protein [Entomomonas asaccharolytica]QQP84383.1 App1 family protein [Entomomonas asaccharolytica]